MLRPPVREYSEYPLCGAVPCARLRRAGWLSCRCMAEMGARAYTEGCVALLLAADATTVFMCGEEDDCDCHGTLLFGRRSDGSAIPYVSARSSTPVSTQRTALLCLLRRPERERSQGVGCACLPTDD